jgi:hypothetical protein
MKAGVEALPDDVETLKAALSRARSVPRGFWISLN